MADEERLGRFLSRLAHDVRNSTSLVTLNLDMLAREVSSQRGQECLQDSREAIRRLDAMSRFLSQIMKPPMSEPAAQEVAIIAREQFDLALQRRSDEAAPHLSATLEVGASRSFRAPPELFEIVFACLFDNALDAIESHGQGTVKVHAEGDKVVIENDGPPIPEFLRPCLFDPFVSSVTHKRYRPGLGLTRARSAARRSEVGLELASSDASLTRFVLRFGT